MIAGYFLYEGVNCIGSRAAARERACRPENPSDYETWVTAPLANFQTVTETRRPSGSLMVTMKK